MAVEEAAWWHFTGVRGVCARAMEHSCLSQTLKTEAVHTDRNSPTTRQKQFTWRGTSFTEKSRDAGTVGL